VPAGLFRLPVAWSACCPAWQSSCLSSVPACPCPCPSTRTWLSAMRAVGPAWLSAWLPSAVPPRLCPCPSARPGCPRDCRPPCLPSVSLPVYPDLAVRHACRRPGLAVPVPARLPCLPGRPASPTCPATIALLTAQEHTRTAAIHGNGAAVPISASWC